MKNLSALICSAAVLIFSATVHAAPVQYQIRATHTQETANGIPVDPSSYLFADGTAATASFYYDAAVPALGNLPGSPSTFYSAGSGWSIEIAGASTITGAGDLMTVITDSSISPNVDTIALVSQNVASPLTFGDLKLTRILFGLIGPTDMLSNRSLPQTLPGLNSTVWDIFLDFQNSSGVSKRVEFQNGAISQVPLPSAALFFLSGLIGLSANIFRKTKI